MCSSFTGSTVTSSLLVEPVLVMHCVQGRIKGAQRGQLPRAPRCKRAPRDEICLFQIKYLFEKFGNSEGIQEYNSI